jgi:hypothetical protein
MYKKKQQHPMKFHPSSWNQTARDWLHNIKIELIVINYRLHIEHASRRKSRASFLAQPASEIKISNHYLIHRSKSRLTSEISSNMIRPVHPHSRISCLKTSLCVDTTLEKIMQNTLYSTEY